jgi:hypothetical protein
MVGACTHMTQLVTAGDGTSVTPARAGNQVRTLSVTPPMAVLPTMEACPRMSTRSAG